MKIGRIQTGKKQLETDAKPYEMHRVHAIGLMMSDAGIYDILPGLWIWRARHPFWSKGEDYQQVVTSTFVESNGERIVIDPLSPSLDCIGLWERLDSNPPTMAVVTMPDHVRDVDIFAKRYNLKSFGPMFFFPDQVPNSNLTPIIAEKELPGGVIPLYDARGRLETPIFLPLQRTIVFGDALMESEGVLRVWDSPWHSKRELNALKEMLNFPFETVIVSHCDEKPVHTRADFERALSLDPFRWH